MKNIFIDLKLLLFVILTSIIMYGIYYYKDGSELNGDVTDIKNSRVNEGYKYGNIETKTDSLSSNDIDKLNTIKNVLYNIDIDVRTKMQIMSNLKKFMHIYINYHNYDYKKNWLEDLVDRKTQIYNQISAINVAYNNKDEDIERLYLIVKDFIDTYINKINSHNVYNSLEHPSGYHENKYDIF